MTNNNYVQRLEAMDKTEQDDRDLRWFDSRTQLHPTMEMFTRYFTRNFHIMDRAPWYSRVAFKVSWLYVTQLFPIRESVLNKT